MTHNLSLSNQGAPLTVSYTYIVSDADLSFGGSTYLLPSAWGRVQSDCQAKITSSLSADQWQ